MQNLFMRIPLAEATKILFYLTAFTLRFSLFSLKSSGFPFAPFAREEICNWTIDG